jgi:serine/threonine protein kinase
MDEFSELHELGAPLGEGAFGKVYALHLKSGQTNPYPVPVEELCVKVIKDRTNGGHRSIDLSSVDAQRMLSREVDGPSAIAHPHVVKAHKLYRAHNAAGRVECVYVVMSVVKGAGDGVLVRQILQQFGLAAAPPEVQQRALIKELGGPPELFRYLLTRHFLNENQVKFAAYQLLLALECLHNAHPRPIMHRDLKCENVLVAREMATSAGPVPYVQIADFGHARTVPARLLEDLPDLVTISPVESGQYVAPELRTDRYDCLVDIFSLGVIVYVMFCKSYPFSTPEEDARARLPPSPTSGQAWLKHISKARAAAGEWARSRLEPGQARVMSAAGRDLIGHMLQPSPRQRWTASQCLADAWFDDVRAEAVASFGGRAQRERREEIPLPMREPVQEPRG